MATETREIVTILTIDARQAEQGARQFAAALENTAKSSDELAKAVARGEQTLDASAKVTRRNAQELENLLRAFDPLYGANQRLAESQEKLARAGETVDAQFRKGLITDQQRVERMTLLTGRSAELTKITDDLSKGLINHETAQIRSARVMATHTQAAGQLTNAIGLTRAQMQALSPQINDVVSGLIMGQQPMQIFTQQSGQIVQALQAGGAEMPKFRASTLAMAGGIGIATAAVAAIGIKMLQVHGQTREFSTMLKAAGQQAVMTADQVRAAADRIYDAGGSREDISAVLGTAINSRKFSSVAQLEEIGKLAVDIGVKFGGTAEAGKNLVEWLTSGIPGLQAMARETEALSLAQYEAARAALEHGNKAQAQQIIIAALKNRFDGLHRDSLGPTEKALKDVSRAYDDLATAAASHPITIKIVTEFTGPLAGLMDMLSGKSMMPQGDQASPATIGLSIGKIFQAWMEGQVAGSNGLLGKANAVPMPAPKPKSFPMAGTSGGLSMPTQTGLSASEARDLSDLKEANDKLLAAMQKVGAERQVAMAQAQAEIAALKEGKSAFAAEAAGIEAARMARAQMAAGIADANVQLSLSAQYTLASASAYLQAGEAAGAYAEALRQAKQEELSTGVNAEARAKQLMAERAAQSALAGAQQVPGLEREAEARQKIAAAAMQGVQAQQQAELAYKIEQATLQERLALSNANAETEAILLDIITRKTKAITAEDAAQRKLIGEQAITQAKQDLAYAQAELSLMGKAEPYRERALQSIRIQNQAMATFRTTTSDVAKQWIALQEQIADTQAIKAFQSEIRSTAKEMSRDITQTLLDRDAKWSDLGKTIGKRIALGLIEANIVLPITTAAVGAVPALFGIQGPAAGGGAGAATAVQNGAVGMAANFGMSQVGGWAMSKLFPGGGFSLGSAIDNFGMGLGFGPGSNFVGPMMPGTEGILGMTSLSELLGGAGLGFGAGSILNSLVGGNAVGGTIGSGVGGLAGAAIGSLVPGVGTLIGGLIGGAGGGLLGGMFGNDQPSNKEGNVSIDFASGKATVGGQTGEKFSAENRQAAAGIGGQIQQLAVALESLIPGQQIKGSGLIAVGNRDGLRAEYGGKTAEFGKGDTAGLAAWFAKQFSDDLKDGFEKGDLPAQVAGNLQKVLDKGVTGTVEQFLADMTLASTDFTKAFDSMAKAQPDQAALEMQSAAQSFITMQSAAQKLGLTVDGLAESFKAGTDRMLDAQIRAAQGLTGTTSAQVIRASFTTNATALLSAGQDPSKAVALYGAQMAALVNSFGWGVDALKQLAAMAKDLEKDDPVAALYARTRAEQVRTVVAEDLAMREMAAKVQLGQVTQEAYDMAALELQQKREMAGITDEATLAMLRQTQATEKQALAAQKGAKAAEEAAKAFASASASTRSYLLSLMTGEAGGLSAQDRYANARNEYASASAAIGPQATAEQLQRQTEAAKALLDASRAMNGSTTEYFRDLANITSDLAKSAQLQPDDPVVAAINALKASVDGLGGKINVQVSVDAINFVRGEIEQSIRTYVSLAGLTPREVQLANGILDAVNQSVTVALSPATGMTARELQLYQGALSNLDQSITALVDTSSLTGANREIALGQLSDATRTINGVLGQIPNMTDVEREFVLGTSRDFARVFNAFVGAAPNLTAVQQGILFGISDSFTRTYQQAVGVMPSMTADQQAILQGVTDSFTRTFQAAASAAPTLSADQLAILKGKTDEFTRTFVAATNDLVLTDDERAILAAKDADIKQTLTQSVTKTVETTETIEVSRSIDDKLSKILAEIKAQMVAANTISADGNAVLYGFATGKHWMTVTSSYKGGAGMSFETGGVIPGGVVGNGIWGKDSVMARYAGGGTIALAGGEGILTAPATAAIGGPGMVDAINRHRALPVAMAPVRSMVMPVANSNRASSNGEMVSELRALREEVATLRRENTAMIQKQALMDDAGMKAQTAALAAALSRKSKQAASAA